MYSQGSQDLTQPLSDCHCIWEVAENSQEKNQLLPYVVTAQYEHHTAD